MVFVNYIILSMFLAISGVSSENRLKYEKGIIEKYANNAGKKLRGCCSTCYKDTKVEVHDYEQSSGKYVISMTVSWTGCSSDYYYISGKLTVGTDGCNPTWNKTRDSGGFVPGCGSKCYLGCLN
jgi:hypothetical protein